MPVFVGVHVVASGLVLSILFVALKLGLIIALLYTCFLLGMSLLLELWTHEYIAKHGTFTRIDVTEQPLIAAGNKTSD